MTDYFSLIIEFLGENPNQEIWDQAGYDCRRNLRIPIVTKMPIVTKIQSVQPSWPLVSHMRDTSWRLILPLGRQTAHEVDCGPNNIQYRPVCQRECHVLHGTLDIDKRVTTKLPQMAEVDYSSQRKRPRIQIRRGAVSIEIPDANQFITAIFSASFQSPLAT